MKNRKQSGFGTLEALLLVIIIGLIGFTGWYAWHSKQQTDKTFSSANSANANLPHYSQKPASASPTTQQAKNYITIKEWGVRAPYNGGITLSYKIDGNNADFTSKQLTDANPGCSDFGGHIGRFGPNDVVDSVGDKAADWYLKNKDSSTVKIKYLKGYYYMFFHDQSLCSAVSGPSDPAATIQSQTNDAVNSLVPNLEIVPSS